LSWSVDDSVLPDLTVAGNKIALFNITDGPGEFFLSTKSCNYGFEYAISRKDGVTNNACTPPCTLAMSLSTGYYFYCSSIPDSSSGVIHVLECDKLANYRCGKVTGCGWSTSDSKCKACIDAKNRDDCEALENCTWCEGDSVCLHEKSNACRGIVEKDRAVPSWVWLLITLCALVVLVAVMVTLFLSERGFRKRWAAISKTDKDFAEVGKGANDGLYAN